MHTRLAALKNLVYRRYQQLIELIPQLWGYPFFCWIMRRLRSEKQRSPRGQRNASGTVRSPVDIAAPAPTPSAKGITQS